VNLEYLSYFILFFYSTSWGFFKGRKGVRKLRMRLMARWWKSDNAGFSRGFRQAYISGTNQQQH